MSKHDSAVFAEFEELVYNEVLLDDVINNNGDQLKSLLCQCLEKYALNPDYTIDLPVYVLLDKSGKYRGHHQGAATVTELRDIIKNIVYPSE
jgi:cytochrome c oxidase assembly protein Cox11